MYLCPDIAEYPGAKLLALVWEVRRCDVRLSTHPRLQMVWSKLQLEKLLDPQFDLCIIIDTETMAVPRQQARRAIIRPSRRPRRKAAIGRIRSSTCASSSTLKRWPCSP